MNPIKKWDWFTLRRPEYKGTAEIAIKQIWNDFYKDQPPTPPISSQTPSYIPQNPPSTSFDEDDDPLEPTPLGEVDAYKSYCDTPRVPNESCKPSELAQWWRDHPQNEVMKMAWDTLAIPAMSAECERLFSSASRLIASGRNNMKDDAMEANECLKNWYTQGIGGPNSTG